MKWGSHTCGPSGALQLLQCEPPNPPRRRNQSEWWTISFIATTVGAMKDWLDHPMKHLPLNDTSAIRSGLRKVCHLGGRISLFEDDIITCTTCCSKGEKAHQIAQNQERLTHHSWLYESGFRKHTYSLVMWGSDGKSVQPEYATQVLQVAVKYPPRHCVETWAWLFMRIKPKWRKDIVAWVRRQ